PEPDALDVARREVVEPRAVRGGPRVGLALRGRAAVADPRLRVLGRVLHLALHDPPVEARLVEPRAHALVPRHAAAMLPVAEELGHAPGREHRPDARHEVADDVVARAPAVAVLVLGQRAARG